jgi:hypothetical protein
VAKRRRRSRLQQLKADVLGMVTSARVGARRSQSHCCSVPRGN